MEYLYTSCEDILCRSLAPMQDTPAVKFLWSAKIRIPKEFDVYMSAVKTTRFNYNATFDEVVFVAPVKVQAYLIALVVGDLKNQTI